MYEELRVCLTGMQRKLEFLEQQQQKLMPMDVKMRPMGHKLQSLRDKHREREGQIKKFRSRENSVKQTMKDAKKAVPDAQEELQRNAQKPL